MQAVNHMMHNILIHSRNFIHIRNRCSDTGKEPRKRKRTPTYQTAVSQRSKLNFPSTFFSKAFVLWSSLHSFLNSISALIIFKRTILLSFYIFKGVSSTCTNQHHWIKISLFPWSELFRLGFYSHKMHSETEILLFICIYLK